MTSNGEKTKRPVGLFIFGWLLIISSLVHMATFIFYHEWYWTIFNYLPDWVITVRYCGSWLQRILGISAGIGLLTGNKVCRRIAIWISVYTILTLYWKHEYPAFLNHCRMLDECYGGIFSSRHLWGWSFVRLCKISLMGQYIADIIFFGTLLYYLNRPLIKKYFERSHPKN